MGKYNSDMGKWREKSPLKIFGYSVSQSDGLTDTQRQTILEALIDYHILTKDRVLSYLDFFARVNGYRNDYATGKWLEDRKCIANYEIGTATRVKTSCIIL